MDVLKMVRKAARNDGFAGYIINGDDLYPAALKDLQEKAANDDFVFPLFDLQTYVHQARALPDVAWKLALIPSNKVSTLEPEDRNLRTQALELARRWFTALLRAEHGDDEQIALRIETGKDNRWKL